VQSDDPAIQRQSAEIVGSAREPAAKADRLAAWVAHRIGPLAPGLALSSAAQTLRLKRGDLTARGHLFMALARSAGLPVRRVAGARIVGESFYNEGWVEVYLGWWTPVDLTQGRIGGPAARVRLARDAGRWTEFVPLFGSVGLRLEPRTIIP
jgi:transglutaminase-like putative cysteine protease